MFACVTSGTGIARRHYTLYCYCTALYGANQTHCKHISAQSRATNFCSSNTNVIGLVEYSRLPMINQAIYLQSIIWFLALSPNFQLETFGPLDFRFCALWPLRPCDPQRLPKSKTPPKIQRNKENCEKGGDLIFPTFVLPSQQGQFGTSNASQADFDTTPRKSALRKWKKIIQTSEIVPQNWEHFLWGNVAVVHCCGDTVEKVFLCPCNCICIGGLLQLFPCLLSFRHHLGLVIRISFCN